MNNKKSDRRLFFKKAGTGLLGFSLLSSIPLNIFGKSNNVKKLKTVTEHPLAVKRDK